MSVVLWIAAAAFAAFTAWGAERLHAPSVVVLAVFGFVLLAVFATAGAVLHL